MSLFDTLLPAGARWSRIGDAYDVTKKPRHIRLTSFDAIPFASMDSIPQGGPYHPKYTLKSPTQVRSGTYFETGDILLAKITPSFENGKQALAVDMSTSFAYATTEVIPLRPSVDRHDPRLLFFYLLHPDVRNHIAERMEGSTGRKRVPVDVLLDVPYPEFPAITQVAIADCLEVIQRMMIVESDSVRTAERLKSAATRALFTRSLQHRAQEHPEIGSLPDDWRVVRLGTVRSRLQYGTSVRCTYDRTCYPVLRIPNVERQQLNLDDIKYCDASATEATKFQLQPGDLILVRTNGVRERLGTCAVYSGEPANALFASYLIRASLESDIVDSRFVAVFLNSEVGMSLVSDRSISAADGKFNLNYAAIDSLPLPVPSIEEQLAIVALVERLQYLIDLHRSKRKILTKLLVAILHRIVTGDIDAASFGDPNERKREEHSARL